jgi:hypothetical protein
VFWFLSYFLSRTFPTNAESKNRGVVDDRVVAVRRSGGEVEGLLLEAAGWVLIAAYCRGEGMFMPGMFGQVGKLVGEKVRSLRRAL